MGGASVAERVKEQVMHSASCLRKCGIHPCLATVLVGDDPASAIYVRNKHLACTAVGIETRDHKLPIDATQIELTDLIDQLADDDGVHGILVQLPLPRHMDMFGVVSRIPPAKDVDGLTPASAGLLASGRASLVACTPLGIMRMLDYYGVELAGMQAVIINRSPLVGIPLYHLMLQRNATVTTCHSKTRELTEICHRADVVVTGVGRLEKFVLTADMIQEGAVVVDVAINRTGTGLRGDADYDAIMKKAYGVTPVPGGVGLMTVAMLLRNTIVAAGGEDV